MEKRRKTASETASISFTTSTVSHRALLLSSGYSKRRCRRSWRRRRGSEKWRKDGKPHQRLPRYLSPQVPFRIARCCYQVATRSGAVGEAGAAEGGVKNGEKTENRIRDCLDIFHHKYRFASRAAAIKWLLEAALSAKLAPPKGE